MAGKKQVISEKMMQKNLLVGNGINIQFGGYDSCSNEAIIKRVLKNINSGRTKTYLPACNKEELITVFEKSREIITNIKSYKPKEKYLFLLMEIDRISKQYKPDTPIERIGMEDFFICMEYLKEKSDSDDFLQEAHRGSGNPEENKKPVTVRNVEKLWNSLK